jgi:hypothetical protein
MPIQELLTNLGIPLPENLNLTPDAWVDALNVSPLKSTATVVGLSAVLFYVLEKHHNPKVNELADAAVYCSTCLSVGYGDIFAKSPLGKLLGSALMTIGPALASKTLDGAADVRRDDVQRETLETLRQILARLQDSR